MGIAVERAPSVRSCASQAKSKLLEIARKKLQVRRQLLNLDRQPIAVIEASPMEVSGDGNGVTKNESSRYPAFALVVQRLTDLHQIRVDRWLWLKMQ